MILSIAIQEIKTRIQRASPTEAVRDTAITELEKKLQDISNNGLGGTFLLGKRTFGGGNKWGGDIYLVGFLLLLEYAALCTASYSPEESNAFLYWCFFIGSFVATLIPLFLIRAGNKHIVHIETAIAEKYKNIDEAYSEVSKLKGMIKLSD